MMVAHPTSQEDVTVTVTDELRRTARQALERCGVVLDHRPVRPVAARTPLTGDELFAIPGAGVAEVEAAIATAHAAFTRWRTVPAPVRGALVKRLGELIGEHQSELADLVTVEVGKIRS